MKAMAYFSADIYLMAHIHAADDVDPEMLGANSACTKIKKQSRLGLITGSYFKTYAQGLTTYGERPQYKPAKLGAVSVYIKPYHKELRIIKVIK